MEMAKILELKKLKITITERFILMDDRMLDLARLRILRLEENSFGIEDKGFDLSYRNHSKLKNFEKLTKLVKYACSLIG